MEVVNDIKKSVSVARLLDALEFVKSSKDDRIDVYLKVVSHISEDIKYFVEDLSRSAVLVLKHIKVDLKKDEPLLLQAALQALGYILHHKDIVSSFSGSILSGILEDLFALMKGTKDKSVCTRSLWCLSRQNIPDKILAEKLETLLSIVEMCILSKHFESSSVEFEALNVIKRMISQFPEEMATNKDDWFRLVYPFVISKAPKVADSALNLMENNIQMIKANSANFSKTLISDLKEGLTERLRVLFSKDKELYVMRVWSCFISILDKVMHQGSPLTNSLFKVVEQAFKTNSSEVLIAAYKAWTTLIDNFATSRAAIRSKKRLKLLLMPLVNSTAKSERDPYVEKARLDTWWHLICILRTDLDEVFEQVVAPLLLFIFSAEKPVDTKVDLKLLKTPTREPNVDNSKISTPGTPACNQYNLATKSRPKTSNVHFESNQLKLVGAQILYCLLKPENGEELLMKINKEKLIFKRISVETFKNSSVLFYIALQDLTIHCGKDIEDTLLLDIWSSYCQYITEIANADEKENFTVSFGGLLQSLERLVEIDGSATKIALQIITNCYMDLNEMLKTHRGLLKTDSNPQGSFAVHIFQMLFSGTRYINGEYSSSRKFFRLVDTVIKEMMSGAAEQLTTCHQIIGIISDMACYFQDKEPLWRFWDTTVNILQKYINRTNNINQGTNLQHDFATMLDLLLFPIKNLLDANLPMAMSKAIDANWEKLFSVFVREAALVATVDKNQAVEDICFRIDLQFKNEQLILKKLKFIGRLIDILRIIAEKLEYGDIASENQLSTTPSNQSNLGNAKSLVVIVLRILYRLAHLDDEEIDSKSVDQHIGAVLHLIRILFSKIVGENLIKEAIERFSNPMIILLTTGQSPADSKSAGTLDQDKKVFISKQIHVVRKVLDAIYNCILERFGGKIDSQLLVSLTPLLKLAFGSDKEFIRSQVCGFWNKSFGLARRLHYPEDLKKILNEVKKNVHLRVPGFKATSCPNVDLDIRNIQEPEESSEGSVLTQSPLFKIAASLMRSPHRVHGSFLQKSLSAVKCTTPPVSKNPAVVKSPRSEPRRQAVRRKLPISIATNDEEFVRIAPSPKKRRILTEHQKEVMGLKSAIPVLYNQLDQATQDAIISDDTQFTQDSFPPKFGKEDPSPKKDVANPLSMDSNAELVEDSEQLFGPLPTEPKADILGKIIKSSPKQDSLSPKNVELSSKQTDEGVKDPASENVTANACAVENKDGSLDTNGVRTSPRSLKKKQGKNYVASTKSAKLSSILKPKARRSVAKTFKSFLSSLSSEDEIAKESVEAMETDDKTSEAVVIPSSYTFSETSTVDQAIPFTFSTGSYFSSKDKASSSTISSDNAPVDVADTVENGSDNLVTKSCSLTGSTSPDIIPSSQSQKDLTPVLTGISLIKPRRRSARKSKVIVTEDIILQVNKPPVATAVVDKALPIEHDATKDIVDSKAEGDVTRIPEGNDLDNSVAEETLGNTQVTEATEIRKNTGENTEVIADDANAHKGDSNEMQTCSTQKSNGQDLTSQKQTDEIIEPNVPESNFTDQPCKQGPTQQLKVVIDKLVLEKDLCSDSNNKGIEDCFDVQGRSKPLRVVKVNHSSQTDPTLCDDDGTESAHQVLDSSACDSLDNIMSTDLVPQDDKRTTSEENLCHEIPNTHLAVVDSKSKSKEESCVLEEASSKIRNEEKGQPTEVTELSNNRQALGVTDKKSNYPNSRKKNVARKGRGRLAKKVEDDASTPKSPSKSNEGIQAKALKQTPDINESQFKVEKSAISLKDVSMKALVETSERQGQNDEKGAYLANKEIKGDTPNEKGDDQSVFINVVKTLKSFLQDTPKSNQCEVADNQVSCSNSVDELGSDSEQQRAEISEADGTTASTSSEEVTQKETAKVLDDSDDSQSLINGKTPIVLTKERTRAALKVDAKIPLVITPSNEVNSPKTNTNSKNTDLEPTFYAKDLGFVAESLKNLHDLDSSFEDQLSLSTIKKLIQTPIVIDDTDPDSEPLTRKIDLTEAANKCQTEATVAGSCAKEQENVNLEPDLSIVAMVGAEVKSNEKRKISRKRKRDLVEDPEEMDSETIEGIFESADKPSECPSVDTSFQIIESKETTVQVNQMVDLEKSNPVKLIKEKDTTEVVSGKTKTKGASCVQENALLSMVCQAELVPTKIARNTRSAKSPRSLDRKDDICISSVNCAPEKPIPVLVVDGELAIQNNDEKSTSALSDKQFPPISFAQPRRDCSSPLQIKRIATATSPSLSPISGILKKRLAKKNESPSPTNKNRRVSFAYPLEEKRSIDDDKNDKNAELAVPLPDDKASATSSGNGTPKRLTSLKRKYTSPKVISQIPGTPICSELITCSTPIEKLLPSLTSATWSRGLGNIIRAQNIRTIGNLCALSETQIEGLPIRSPKVNVVKKALRKFQTDKTKLEKKEISWNGIQGADSPLSAMTPTKPKEQTDQLNHKGTPSRKGLSKPTSLFPDKSNNKSGDKHDPVLVDSVVPLEVDVQWTDKNLNTTPTSTVSLETHQQNGEHQLEAIEDSNVPGVNVAPNTFAPATVLGPTGENRMKDVEETVVSMETCPDIKDNRTSVFVVSVSPVATQGQNREIHLKLATDSVTALTACAQENDNKAAIAASSAAEVASHIEEKEQYTVTENMQEEAGNNDVIAKSTPSCNDELKAALSAVEAEMTNERLSQLSAHDSFLIHEKLTELSKRVFDSLRSKMTEQAVENK